MMHTIENRMEHPDIKSDIYSDKEYHTLKYEKQDYKLSEEQSNVINRAFEEKDQTPNQNKLGWDTSQNSIKSNKYYEWTADPEKQGAHYYY